MTAHVLRANARQLPLADNSVDLDDPEAFAAWASKQSEIVAEAAEGRTLLAVKALRRLTGATYSQARNAVDEL